MTRDHFHHSLGWEAVREVYKTTSLLILLAQFPLSAVTAELEMSLELMALQSPVTALSSLPAIRVHSQKDVYFGYSFKPR